MKKLSIVMPTYFNEPSIPLIFERLQKVEEELLKRDIELELICVDDGSGDDSLAELLRIREQRKATKVIKLTRNFGAMHASRTGLRFVTGDCFLMLAADLQDPPELILEMVDRWLNGAKYVLCVRTAREDPWLTRAAARIYYFLLRKLVMKNYPRQGYDMALMDKVFLPYLLESRKNINTPHYAYWLGFKPEMIPYKREKRPFGKSQWSFSKRMTLFIDSLLGFSIIPIRTMSIMGFTVAGISISYGLFIFLNGLLGRIPVPGWATLVTLLAFLLGMMMIMFGIIGEYVWRIFDELNKIPEAVIDEVYQ